MTALKSVQIFGLAILLSTMTAGLSVNAQQYEDGYIGNQGYGGYGEQIGMANGYGNSYAPNTYMPPAPPMRPMPPQGYGGYGRPPVYGGAVYGQNPCEAARREMRTAQMGLTISVNNLNNLGSVCNDGNSLCIIGYQNVYNTAVTNVQKAQQKVDRACSYGGRPRY